MYDFEDEYLPEEIQQTIANYLEHPEVLKTREVSTRWKAFKAHCKQEFIKAALDSPITAKDLIRATYERNEPFFVISNGPPNEYQRSEDEAVSDYIYLMIFYPDNRLVTIRYDKYSPIMDGIDALDMDITETLMGSVGEAVNYMLGVGYGEYWPDPYMIDYVIKKRLEDCNTLTPTAMQIFEVNTYRMPYGMARLYAYGVSILDGKVDPLTTTVEDFYKHINR